MEWPKRPPEDLERRIQQVLSWRNHGALEVYAAFAEWCEKHGVVPPEITPTAAKSTRTIYEDLDQEPREGG